MEKLPAVSHGARGGCLNCPANEDVARLDDRVIAGFGAAVITKDGDVVFEASGNLEFDDAPTLQKFEDMALKEPDADWRFLLTLPLRDAVWQRQGPGKWVLVQSGNGFA